MKNDVSEYWDVLQGVVVLLLAIVIFVQAVAIDSLQNRTRKLEASVEELQSVKLQSWDKLLRNYKFPAIKASNADCETEPYQYTDEDWLVMRVMTAESKGEPIEGQMAVAQCILDTSQRTGKSLTDVVLAKNQYAQPAKQNQITQSIRQAFDKVVLNGERVTEEPIEFFYSIKGGFVSTGHENKHDYVLTIGYHKFFKLRETCTNE